MIEIAIIEDDFNLREELALMCSDYSFRVHETNSGRGLDDILSTTRIDILLLDINLPGESGISICKRIREQLPNIGIVIMTALPEKNLRIDGYESGADLYISKPLVPQELINAIRNLSKRLALSNNEKKWHLQTHNQILTAPSGKEINLTNKENKFLIAMIQSRDSIINFDNALFLIDRNNDSTVTKRALENFVSRLRKKILSHYPEIDSPIKAVSGIGYKLYLVISLA